MRILVSAGTAQSLAGFRLPLLRALRQAGHEVHACSPDDDPSAPARLAMEQVRFHPIHLRRAAISPIGDMVYAWEIYALVKALRIQGYLGYTHKPICLGLPAAAAAGARIRVALITGLGFAFTGEQTPQRWLAQAVIRLLYRHALPEATHLFFQNQDDQDEFGRHGLLADAPVPELVAGSGVPLDEYPAHPLPPAPPVFLMLSRLLADKGVREYVAAAKQARRRIPGARFLLAGSLDPNPSAIGEHELRTWIDADAIEYMGALPDVRPALKACTVYVLPSYREGTPRSVLEALATGRPILTTDAPGCRETLLNLQPVGADGIRRADNGLAVPVANAELLADAMCQLASDSDQLARFACTSRQYAESRFDALKVASALARSFV